MKIKIRLSLGCLALLNSTLMTLNNQHYKGGYQLAWIIVGLSNMPRVCLHKRGRVNNYFQSTRNLKRSYTVYIVIILVIHVGYKAVVVTQSDVHQGKRCAKKK